MVEMAFIDRRAAAAYFALHDYVRFPSDDMEIWTRTTHSADGRPVVALAIRMSLVPEPPTYTITEIERTPVGCEADRIAEGVSP